MKPHAPPPAGVRRGGFTFVELLVVVMLLGVLAGVAAPRYADALSGIELETTAKQMAADLRYARNEAIRRGRSVALEFNPVSGVYGSDSTAATPINDPQQPDRVLSKQVGGRSGVRIDSADFGGVERLTFDFRGEPISSGAVTLQGGGDAYTVRVDALGEVRVE